MKLGDLQTARTGEASMRTQGGQILMLQGSQQAEVPPSLPGEHYDSQAFQTGSGSEKLVTSSTIDRSPSSRSIAVVRPYVLNFESTRSLCQQDCDCSCHGQRRFKSPGYLRNLFGSLLIGYSLGPWITRQCDNTDCRGRSTWITYTYAFPRWLFNQMITLNIAYHQLRGPELCLRMVRARSRNDHIFYAVINVDLDMNGMSAGYIGSLFDRGIASVLDVDPDGRSALQVRRKPFYAHIAA